MGSGLVVLWADLDLGARTVAGEARGLPVDGQRAVACAIVNRAIARHRGELHVAGVVLEPWQFSCWNAGDPNRDVICDLAAADRVYRVALGAFLWALDAAGTPLDPTFGATHYWHDSIPTPAWARGAQVLTRLDGHTFVRVA